MSKLLNTGDGNASAVYHGDTQDEDGLDRRSSWNWFLLVGALLLTTVGLVMVVPSSVSERFANSWLWAKTDFALVTGYSVLILAFVVYLTVQRRRVAVLRKRLHMADAEVVRRGDRHSERLYALCDVSQVMGLESDLQTVFDSITTACLDAFDCDQASLMLYDSDTKKLKVRSAYGHEDTSRVIGAEMDLGSGISGWVALHKEPLVLGKDHTSDLPEAIKMESKTVALAMVVPILIRDELVGVINVSSRSTAAEFEKEDLSALRVFASNAGACIRHTEQAEWMRTTIRNLQKVPN